MESTIGWYLIAICPDMALYFTSSQLAFTVSANWHKTRPVACVVSYKIQGTRHNIVYCPFVETILYSMLVLRVCTIFSE